MEKNSWFTEIIKAPIQNLCLIIGVILILLSFDPVSYTNGILAFHMNKYPINWILFLIGLGLLGAFLIQIKNRRDKKVICQQIPKGVRIGLASGHSIDIITDEIQSVIPDASHGAIILPANTKFDDDCFKDTNSSLGAFFQKNFPSGIEEAKKLIHEIAKNSATEYSEGYHPGTTIYLNRPFGSGYHVLITAVTRLGLDGRISADTVSLMTSLKEVLHVAASNRLTELWTPVLGTGHGGLDFSTALSLMLLQIAYCLTHEGAHQVRKVIVVVYDPTGLRKTEVSKIVEAICMIFKR